MHEHDRKLDSARTERIESMEVCPVCGEQRRSSARFCTTCGQRFATDEMADIPAVPASPDVYLDPHAGADPVISGWPAPASQVEASPWAPPAEDRGGWPAPPMGPEGGSDSSEVTWAEVAATAFGSPRRAPLVAERVTSSETIDEFEAIEEADPEPNQSGARTDDRLRERARSLISELREVIEGLTGESSSASGDLADELEISLTRPAALDGEALADLRTVAESAQARPRDLDTLTALTAQADTIVALIVGYERATAGIERAIETLRSSPGHADD